jgi:hypothetical protein
MGSHGTARRSRVSLNGRAVTKATPIEKIAKDVDRGIAEDSNYDARDIEMGRPARQI